MAEAEDLAEAIGELETELVLVVRNIEEGRHTAHSGAAGTTQWLQRSCGLAPQRARSVVKTARFVGEHPETQRMLATRDVALPKIEALAQQVRGRRDALYKDHAETLLDLATSLSYRDFTKALRHWVVLADDVLTDREHMERHEVRRLHISTTMHGMVAGEFFLEPVAGQRLIRALDALTPPDAQDVPGGPRTLPQRRADALAELAARYLSASGRSTKLSGSSGSSDETSPDRPGRFVPHLAVNVMVDLATLTEDPGPTDWSSVRSEIDGIGPVGRSTIRRIICDGHLRRVIVDSQSNVINQGRATRFATPAQRAALVVRDGGCIGCGRPSHWTEVHHVRGWVNASGETNLDELVLVCQRCHTLVHEGGWRVERRSDGRFALEPPDP